MFRQLNWLRYSGTLICIGGIGLVFLSFFYDILFAGIPYQDPTPELQARYDFHVMIARQVFWSGFSLVATGFILIIWRLLNQKKKSRGRKNP